MPGYIGIDVSKATLEVADRPDGTTQQVANEEAEIRALVGRRGASNPALVVLEATGGYETAVVAALAAAGVPVVVANPRQVRDFGRATGQLAKTDRIDAQLLALFAERVRPTPRPVQRGITQHIRWLEKQLARVDNELDDTIESSPVWRAKDDLLQSVPGVGPRMSRTLLGDLPELGTLTRCLGRRGAARARQRNTPREAHGLGWPGHGTLRVVYERAGREPIQPSNPDLLSAPAHRRQATEGRPYGLHAETLDHPQRDGTHQHALE
jgi:transposase